jgi:hypothetical protein
MDKSRHTRANILFTLTLGLTRLYGSQATSLSRGMMQLLNLFKMFF